MQFFRPFRRIPYSAKISRNFWKNSESPTSHVPTPCSQENFVLGWPINSNPNTHARSTLQHARAHNTIAHHTRSREPGRRRRDAAAAAHRTDAGRTAARHVAAVPPPPAAAAPSAAPRGCAAGRRRSVRHRSAAAPQLLNVAASSVAATSLLGAVARRCSKPVAHRCSCWYSVHDTAVARLICRTTPPSLASTAPPLRSSDVSLLIYQLSWCLRSFFNEYYSNSSHVLRIVSGKFVIHRTAAQAHPEPPNRLRDFSTLLLAAETKQHLSPRHRRLAMSVTLHTNLGDIKCEVFCDQAPRTAENFLALCASGYYDGTIFHRNIKGFMIQGGDPTGTGKGGASIWGKKFADEFRESLKHNARGIMSMANSGPNTNGSQFFITYAKQPHLNGHYTVFAKVIHGFEVLDLMEKAQTGAADRPLAEIRLNRVTIHANPLAN
ncbi:probable inactive peptidyl-prolyl cis-trans isomerase-like 6 isoform X1 [Oryza brachyantha]|nr:probable inactive peptidyl-prolyl cis-trans isomerase-like 6 isoform X1 [Oryza brachyantha]